PRTCAPETLAITWRISHPAIASASATALRMDATVDSTCTTTPLRRPRAGAVPSPTISTPRSPTSPTTTAVLEVPRSSPATNAVRFTIHPPPRRGSRPRPLPSSPRLPQADHRLRVVAQIDLPDLRLPPREGAERRR